MAQKLLPSLNFLQKAHVLCRFCGHVKDPHNAASWDASPERSRPSPGLSWEAPGRPWARPFQPRGVSVRLTLQKLLRSVMLLESFYVFLEKFSQSSNQLSPSQSSYSYGGLDRARADRAPERVTPEQIAPERIGFLLCRALRATVGWRIHAGGLMDSPGRPLGAARVPLERSPAAPGRLPGAPGHSRLPFGCSWTLSAAAI